MKKLLETILRFMAAVVLKRYRPIIIGVTGSVGKTTTKTAIVAVLSTRYRVRGSQKSYNNEIGVPLTIIGCGSAGRSLFGWFGVWLGWIKMIFWREKDYPEVLVLELGADKPGDIEYLLTFLQPQVGVLTAIAPTHLEIFKNIEAVAEEKRKLISAVSGGGFAVLNRDDSLVMASVVKSGVKRKTYGFDPRADVAATDIVMKFPAGPHDEAGTYFKAVADGSTMPIFVPNVLGKPAVLSVLAALAVGLCLDINMVAAAQALLRLPATPGRLRLLAGKKDTLLIDDTYNSSPEAAIAALELLNNMPVRQKGRRIAVLADMLELGASSVELHEKVGRAVDKDKLNLLIVVGERARDIGRSARQNGCCPSHIYSFLKVEEAGQFLDEELIAGDIILIKGSQGMRMERLVKALMAEPEKANKMLVRQDSIWQNS